MAESASHIRLVSSLVKWIADAHFGGDMGHILVDSPDRDARTKPPRVGDAFPDAYATLPSGGVVIGEAKTPRDMQTEHTEVQLRSYLHACSLSPDSVFVFGVPWEYAATAHNLLKLLKRKENIPHVKTVVLDYLQG